MLRYYDEMNVDKNSTILTNECKDDDVEKMGEIQKNECDDVISDFESGKDVHIHCIVKELPKENKFGYTLFFLFVPWPFFIYEFFTSTQYQQFLTKGKQIVSEMAKCTDLKSLILWYLRAMLCCISFVSCLLLWPIAVLFIKYYSDGKYYLSKGKYSRTQFR